MPHEELDRIWRRVKALESDHDDLRDLIRELRSFCEHRFDGLNGTVKQRTGTSIRSLLGTVIAVATGIGVPIAIAILASGGP